MQEKLTEQSVTRLVVFTYVMVGMTALQLYLMHFVKDLSVGKGIDPIFYVFFFFFWIICLIISLFAFIASSFIMAVIALIPTFLLRGVGLRKSNIHTVTKTEYTITICIYFGTIPMALISGLFVWGLEYINFLTIMTASWMGVMSVYVLGVRKWSRDPQQGSACAFHPMDHYLPLQ